MSHSTPSPKSAVPPSPASSEELEENIAYLAKRHRVSVAIVREIARRSGLTERSALEREIVRGKSRR